MEEIKTKIDTHATGKNIQRFRIKKGISILDAKEALGATSSQYIENIENGYLLPPIDVLINLAELFGVKLDNIVSYVRFM